MDIFQFLDSSYTSYHATENVCTLLRQQGFVQLSPKAEWNLKVGGCYFVTQNGSSVVAFKVGKNKVFNICESHTDSPCFKVKGNGVLTGCGVGRINTEKYGGGLLYTFFDRPLKIAGRLLVETTKGVSSKLVESDYNVVIPSLAVHHNPTANESFSVNLQTDTLPLFSQSLSDLYATFTDGKVLDADLYVVPATKAFRAGVDGEFLCSARIDNLTSVYNSVVALCQTEPQNIAVVACLDNEEIGSGTRQGSPQFLERVLARIEEELHFAPAEALAARHDGMILSVDNGHAVHPAHPEKSDPQCTVKLNGGVVIKHNPNYATDGLSAAIFKKLLGDSVPYQDYYNRSNVRCGSTLGLVSSRTLQIKTCDIGLAQLAMHSACETVGFADIERMKKALCLFLAANVSSVGSNWDIK